MLPVSLDNSLSKQVFSLPELAAIQVQSCFSEEKLSALLNKQAVQGSVYITGCGDSLAAAGSMLPAFKMAGVQDARVVEPPTLSRMLGSEQLRAASPAQPLVIVISNSGSADIIFEIITKCKKCGAHTLFITNKEQSRAADAADEVFLLATPAMCNTPGLRSFFASMVGLAAVACRIGTINRVLLPHLPELWSSQIALFIKRIGETLSSIAEQMKNLAMQWKDRTCFEMLGNGAAQYSAMFCMQKVYECSGLFCSNSTVEEWLLGNCHSAIPDQTVTVFISSANGLCKDQLLLAVEKAYRSGRQVLVISDTTVETLPEGVHQTVIPAPDECASVLWQLASFIPASLLAAYHATVLDLNYFGGCYDVATGVFGDCLPYSEAMAVGMEKSSIKICC